MNEHMPTNGKAITALILGILSILLSGFGLILGIIGIFLANRSIKELELTGEKGRNLAIGGRVCSIVGIILSIFTIIVLLFFFSIFIFATM